MSYLGVDLRTSIKHPSTVSLIDDDSRACFIGSFATDAELFEIIDDHQPTLIAIGSPLGLPEGLCCLEPGCACQPVNLQKKGRQSELELARMGISCFFTSKGSITRRLIYRAVQLNRQLREWGHNTIEVYPHATKVILFGDKVPPKNSPRSLPFMKEQLPTLINGLDPYLTSLNRNACDSLINAYTALLYIREDTDLVGTDKEGFVVLPKLIQLDGLQ